MAQPWLLASASPRRRKIVNGLGARFGVATPAVDEVLLDRRPRATAIENARRKAAWCRRHHPRRTCLVADTVVDFRGCCVTKPATPDEARGMLRRFSGAWQYVITAVMLLDPGGEAELRVAVSGVLFRKLNEARIAAYLKVIDPMDKAGAYDIDQCGEQVVQRCTGSRSNVMGLPAEVVRAWLDERT